MRTKSKKKKKQKKGVVEGLGVEFIVHKNSLLFPRQSRRS